METLAETSLPAGLRRTEPSSLIPTSPEGEQSPQNSNPGSVLANIIGTSPGGSSSAHNLLEDHSQSSQDDSGSVVSPVPHPEPEETIENIEKELSESCVDTDSQPALDTGHGKRTTVTASPRNPEQAAASTSSPNTSATGGKAGDANGQSMGMATGTTSSAVSNGGSLPKLAPSGGKPMAMRNFDRKMNKSRGRPKRKAMVALYQSERRQCAGCVPPEPVVVSLLITGPAQSTFRG
uniref:Uncharacterized protein n=1 Tax=Anopheles culicifacies TaxID=139723 RepID=A0A182MMW8_9DIPT